MLVTALEANPDVPKWEVVTERLLHEERKMNDRDGSSNDTTKAMAVHSRSKKSIKCYYCGKLGHFRRNCRTRLADERKTTSSQEQPTQKTDSNATAISSINEDDALVASHALTASTASKWIIDSGATCHMCSDRSFFTTFQSLKQPQEVTLGDGHELKGTGQGTVALKVNLPDKTTKLCELRNVLYVPQLSCNLVSVSKAAKAGKTAEFDGARCLILGTNRRIIAAASRVGSLYYLECTKPTSEKSQASVAEAQQESNLAPTFRSSWSS